MVQNSVACDDFFFLSQFTTLAGVVLFFFLSKKLIYSVLLVSEVQQSESVISTHMSTLGIIPLSAVL